MPAGRVQDAVALPARYEARPAGDPFGRPAGKTHLPGDSSGSRVPYAAARATCAVVVGTGGVEPPTCRLGGDRSIQLSYVPASVLLYSEPLSGMFTRYYRETQ